MNTVNFPDNKAEVRTAVIEMERSQRTNYVKFTAFLVFIFTITYWVFSISLSVNDYIKGVFNG